MKKHAFSELAKTHKSVRMKLRYSALARFQKGCFRTDIAKTKKSLLTSVNRDYRIRRLAMTYFHMRRPHTIIGAAAFHF